MSYFSTWMKNGRSASLVQSAMPAVLALVLAIGPGFNLVLGLVAVIGALAAHMAMNLLDDYFDYKEDMLADRLDVVRKGMKAYTAKYPYLTDGSATVADLRNAIYFFSAQALICGAVVLAFRGWQVAAIAAAGGILGYFYSGKPLQLGYKGLGELVIGVIFGPLLMIGVYLAACGRIDNLIIAISIPVGLLVTNILFTHSFLDKVGDEASDKKTLAGLVGSDKGNLVVSAILNFLPFLVIALASATGYINIMYIAVLVLCVMPLWLFRSLIAFADGKEWNTANPPKYMGNMGNLEQFKAAGLDWFLVRWFSARNILANYCLLIIIVRILVLLFFK